MSVYGLSTYTKEGETLYPHDTTYTDEYASRMCNWCLTDHLYRDEDGNVRCNYRMHSNKPRTFVDFMAYDIICPKCGQRMQLIANALNNHDLALYSCRNCNKK